MKKKVILATGVVALLFSFGTAQAHGGFSWLTGKKYYHHHACGHYHKHHHHKHVHRVYYANDFIW